MNILSRKFNEAFGLRIEDYLNTRLLQYGVVEIDPVLLEDAIREVNMDYSEDTLENLIITYYGEGALNLYYTINNN